MKPFTKALLTVVAVNCAVAALGWGAFRVHAHGVEIGRTIQADIDYRTIRHLCNSGAPFHVDKDKFTCRAATSL